MNIIFFTDVHLVSKSNINRIDNLPETQRNKLKEIIEVANSKEFNIVLSSGDVFDRHNPAISTMNTFTDFVKSLNVPFILCPGNHDLHGYNYKTLDTTGLGYTCKLLKANNKIILMKEDKEFIDCDNVRIHFKATINKCPMTEFIVDRTTNEIHVGLIHDMVYNKDFFGSTTTYNNFNTNLDVLFNGHIHCGHEPEYINDTWYINSGSVTRMHKPKPLFYPRYTTCEIENKKEEWKFENVIFDCSEKDIFNEIEKRSFNDFISSIETKRIDSNALDYMFQKAKVSLSQNAFNALNELYGEVR